MRALGSYHTAFVSSHREAPVDDLFWKPEAQCLSALRTRWRVTGPAWLGLKCVKTGSPITVFGNMSQKKRFFLSSFISVCFGSLIGACSLPCSAGDF